MIEPRGRLPAPEGADVWRGRVSRIDGSGLYVIVERYSDTREHGPCDVVAPAGLPAVDDEVAVGFREDGEAVVLVPGTPPAIPTSLPPSGAAGGALGGTYPNP